MTRSDGLAWNRNFTIRMYEYGVKRKNMVLKEKDFFRVFPPVLRDWVIKGLGMSNLVYATGHIKDPVPLIKKRRGLSPGGRFPPSFIHQVIIITELNKL